MSAHVAPYPPNTLALNDIFPKTSPPDQVGRNPGGFASAPQTVEAVRTDQRHMRMCLRASVRHRTGLGDQLEVGDYDLRRASVALPRRPKVIPSAI
jgi:hypothetical protein